MKRHADQRQWMADLKARKSARLAAEKAMAEAKPVRHASSGDAIAFMAAFAVLAGLAGRMPTREEASRG